MTESAETMIRQRLGRRSIVLVGMMGAGKTIPEIFADHGETAFRDGERRVIARLLDGGPQVLATGGGAFMEQATRTAVARTAVSVWLRAEFDVLMRRVRRRPDRPLLQTADPDATMRTLIERRYPVYAAADLAVVSRDAPHEAIVDDVVAALTAHLDAEHAVPEGLEHDP